MPLVQYRSQVMDYLDLTVGMCKERGIADPVDKRAPGISDEWNNRLIRDGIASVYRRQYSRKGAEWTFRSEDQ